LKTGLTTGLRYTFRAFAVNYNGLSPQSPDGAYYACSAPTDFAAPTVVSQSTTAISIQWTPPSDTGGCQITGYAVFRDNGATGVITTEVNSVNDLSVRDKPSLSAFTITNFPALTDGFTFRF
jgi:hypothetical protein